MCALCFCCLKWHQNPTLDIPWEDSQKDIFEVINSSKHKSKHGSSCEIFSLDASVCSNDQQPHREESISRGNISSTRDPQQPTKQGSSAARLISAKWLICFLQFKIHSSLSCTWMCQEKYNNLSYIFNLGLLNSTSWCINLKIKMFDWASLATLKQQSRGTWVISRICHF